MPGSHYDTLGVRPDASAREIRDAYRRLARIHHPDHGDADAGSMAAINEAYRVLGEPSRRAVYDAALRGAHRPSAGLGAGLRRTCAPPASRHDAGPLPLEARHRDGRDRRSPSCSSGRRCTSRPDRSRPDNLLGPGSCVTIEGNGDAREVTCSGEDDLVVAVLIPLDGRCPDRTVGHRDRQGRGLACVAPVR